MIDVAEIEQMSRSERIRAMELLWRSMAQAPQTVPSPAWHKKVLDQRMAKVAEGQGEFLTLAQLKKRLAQRKA